MQDRGWHAAVEQLKRRLKVSLEDLIFTLRDISAALSEPARDEHRPTLRTLLDDLIALENEFDEVDFDLKKERLWVVTDPIELEGIPLGRFEIRIHWSRRSHTRPYAVKALDPNPAGTDSGITHPHVNDRVLCEGEGRLAIRAALAEGRLFDFFLLVRQVLETYNESSAYVPLASWQGVTCIDCRCVADSEDASYCEGCESDLCSDCVSCCGDCGRCCCSDCRVACRGCHSDFCRRCLTDCRACHESFCGECLTDDLCPTCHGNLEQTDETTELVEDSPPLMATDASLHAPGVGEVGVLA